jgi:hypothetical protein
MVAGLPALVTAWSGHLDFATSERAYLIPVRQLEPVDVAAYGFSSDFGPGQRWAQPDGDELTRMMRWFYDTSSPLPSPASSATTASTSQSNGHLKADETSDSSVDPENRVRLQRLAPEVRARALRTQRNLVSQYNLQAVALQVRERLATLGRELRENELPWPQQTHQP